MSTEQIKVGDVVAWKDVPDGALVRDDASRCYELRLGDRHEILGYTIEGAEFDRDNDPCGWLGVERGTSTIVALGLTGQETADDLRRLAEVFEVREALGDIDEVAIPADFAHSLEEMVEDGDEAGARDVLARTLHAAGWRSGKTAEDAARRLAEAGR